MAFSRKKKIGVFLIIVLLIGSVVAASLLSKGKEITEVQTAVVKKHELLESKVTASGEIRPVKFYNLTAEVAGRVTDIFIKEGDFVKAEQPLLKVDPTSQINSVAERQASLRSQEQDTNSAEIQWRSAENNVNNTRNQIVEAQAQLKRTQSELKLAEADFQRAAETVEAGVTSKAAFDSAKSRVEAAQANVEGQEARIKQLEFILKDSQAAVNRAEATYLSSKERANSGKATLDSAQDQLSKTVKKSPIDGVVSSLPVKEGEFVLANFSTSPLILIADMSQVNVEVKVDETDIANVKLGQPAKVKVDALGDIEIAGEVSEIGHSAVTRSGQTIAQSTNSQEAKDFKVVIKLKAEVETLNRLRPGMSATATVTTDTRNNVLAIPLQSLVVRDKEDADKTKKEQPVDSDVEKTAKQVKTKKDTEQGVFVLKNGKAEFAVVKTGITGDTDIEITSGLTEADKIITGPFRQLRNLKSGTPVKEEEEKKNVAKKDDK